jgi:hypothetical protein
MNPKMMRAGTASPRPPGSCREAEGDEIRTFGLPAPPASFRRIPFSGSALTRMNAGTDSRMKKSLTNAARHDTSIIAKTSNQAAGDRL